MFKVHLSAIGAVAIAVGFAAVAVRGAVIYPMNQASTSAFASSGGQAAGDSRGWDFQVNDPNVVVSQLGVNCYTNVTVSLSLWDNSTQTKLASVDVSSVNRSWVFGDLTNPLSLTQGHTYSVQGYSGSAGTGTPIWYLHSDSAPSSFQPTGTIQMLDMRYGNGISADTFPTQTLALPAVYGVVDIGYTVPEPASLSVLGMVGIALGRRTRR